LHAYDSVADARQGLQPFGYPWRQMFASKSTPGSILRRCSRW